MSQTVPVSQHPTIHLQQRWNSWRLTVGNHNMYKPIEEEEESLASDDRSGVQIKVRLYKFAVSLWQWDKWVFVGPVELQEQTHLVCHIISFKYKTCGCERGINQWALSVQHCREIPWRYPAPQGMIPEESFLFYYSVSPSEMQVFHFKLKMKQRRC